MDWNYIFLVGFTFGVMLILTQRITNPRQKRLFRGFVVTMAIILMIRYQLQIENLVGYFIAIIISYLFWLLIGRYNPVGNHEEIKVYGLND